MYHPAMIGAGGDSEAVATLLHRALRSFDDDPSLARQCLERLSHLIGGPDRLSLPPDALLPERRADVPAPKGKGGLASWQIRLVTRHIDAGLHEAIVTADLAGLAQLSRGHFCRAFRASMGEPPHAYIVRQRVRRAQQLMLEGQDSLSQIAGACGLSDQAHLTRLFKRLVGTTPLAWRRTWQRRD